MKIRLASIVMLLLLFAAGCVFDSFRSPGLYAPEDAGGDAATDAASDASDVDVDMDDTMDAAMDAGDTDMSVADAGDDMGMDMAPDMSDAGMDMGCSNVIGPLPLTTGMVCSSSTEQTLGDCDPVNQTGCDPGERCDLQLIFSGGTPSEFQSQCLPYNCEVSNRGEGEVCQAGQCKPGYKCNQGICKRFCQREDALGCAPDQGCVGSAVARTYGLCQSSCP